MAAQFIRPALEERVNSLMAEMTLAEKIGQMNQMFYNQFTDASQGAQVGSVIFASSALAGKDENPAAQAEDANRLQKMAIEGSRLGIPLLLGRDVIHGHRTVFPIPLAQAASWNPDLAQKAGEIAAREATADGIKWFFSPMLDVARDPRWGRIAEGYGEDPFLACCFARAAVQGIQGDDFSAPDRAVCSAKHYMGYGAAEGGRDYDRVDVSMRTMRDVYLPPFKAAVEAGAGTIMSAFHDFQGIPISANRELLKDVLRDELGFEGFVVSDWNAVLELVEHGVAEDAAHAARLALHAGVDMDMVSQSYLNTLAGEVQAGRTPLEEIDQAVRRILRIKAACGLLDRPYVDETRSQHVMLTPEHRQAARQMAQESMVLLKNESNLLPLDGRFKKVLVYGPLAHARAPLFGSWTLDGRESDVTSIADAMRAAAPAGVDVETPHYMDEALYRARHADVAVLVMGEHPTRSGEASSVVSLELPAGQRQMVEAFADLGIPVVLLVVAGRPLALSAENRLAQAVLYVWHPGVEGGFAAADLVFGHAAPSGRLPVSLPAFTGQVPVYYSHRNTGRPVTPGVFFTTGYVDARNTPLYPFGFGLGYTRFAYSNLSVRSGSGGIEVTADLTNTGERSGVEVAQLYVRDMVGSVTRPVRELKGFERIELQPGATQQLRFHLTPQDLAFTRADGTWGWEPGAFRVWVGGSSASGLQSEFSL